MSAGRDARAARRVRRRVRTRLQHLSRSAPPDTPVNFTQQLTCCLYSIDLVFGLDITIDLVFGLNTTIDLVLGLGTTIDFNISAGLRSPPPDPPVNFIQKLTWCLAYGPPYAACTRMC